MGGLLRNDGKYVIYIIQHKQKDCRWVQSSFDAFGTPDIAFSASGDCWQQTGVHGTFNLSIAEHALAMIRMKHMITQFRLAKVEITQETTVCN